MRYSENSEPPYLYRRWVAVSVIASCLQRVCKLEMGHVVDYPNFYIVLVGPAGRCRKGTAMGMGRLFLDKLGITLAAEATTREALIRALRRCGEMQMSDGTRGPREHASLTVYSQELTVFLGYGNMQLMVDLADWFDCRDRWKYETKSQGIDDIIGVWVNLIGATTPEQVQDALPQNAVGIGLTSRIIFVYENKRMPVALPYERQWELDLKEDLITDLNDIYTMHGNFTLDEEMLSFWEDWYPKQLHYKPFDDSRFYPYFERRTTHIKKLAMIMSVSRGRDFKVTMKDFNRAIEMLSSTEKKMSMALGGLGKSELAEVTHRVMGKIAYCKEIWFEELLGAFYRDVSKEELHKILSTLCSIVDPSTGSKFCTRAFVGGRQKITYRKEEKKDGQGGTSKEADKGGESNTGGNKGV